MLASTLEIGVNSAVLEFNEGKAGIERIMELAGLKIGALQLKENEKACKKHVSLWC